MFLCATSCVEPPFELLDAEIEISQATIAIPTPAGVALGNEIYLMAKPRSDNDKIFLFVANVYSGQPSAYSVFQLSASEKKLVRQFSIDAPGENLFSATCMAMELSADEKTMFLTIGA